MRHLDSRRATHRRECADHRRRRSRRRL